MQKLNIQINHLGRGSWNYQVVEDENGNPVRDYGSDPYPNERECRNAAKYFLENAKYSREYGWHLP